MPRFTINTYPPDKYSQLLCKQVTKLQALWTWWSGRSSSRPSVWPRFTQTCRFPGEIGWATLIRYGPANSTVIGLNSYESFGLLRNNHESYSNVFVLSCSARFPKIAAWLDAMRATPEVQNYVNFDHLVEYMKLKIDGNINYDVGLWMVSQPANWDEYLRCIINIPVLSSRIDQGCAKLHYSNCIKE